MAFTPDITVKNALNADVVYQFVSSAGLRTVRKDTTRPLEEPRVLTISHESVGKGTATVDRHMVRFDQTELDGDNVTSATGSAHIVLTVPRKVVGATEIKDLIAQMISYLETAGNVDKILAGLPG